MDNKNAMVQKFEIQERMRRQHTGARVYNGSRKVQVHMYAAERYRFFPDGVAIDPHTQTPKTYDGVTVITDLYRHNPKALNDWRQAKNKGEATDKDLARLPKDRVATAAEIIAHIVSKNRENGLTELAVEDVFDAEGNVIRTKAEEDDRLKAIAHNLATENEKKRSEDRMKNYRVRTSGLGQNDPEKLYNAEEIEASVFLADYATGKLHKNRFVCRFGCGFWSHDKANLGPHYAVNHKDVLREEDRLETEPIKRGPGRPRKEATV